MAKARWAKGGVFKIPLDDGMYGYGIMLESPVCGFFDFKTSEDISDLSCLMQYEIMFKICVMKHAITQGRWLKVGKFPLMDSSTYEIPYFVNVDHMSGKIYRHHISGKEEISTKEACLGLECAAVWEPEHVEERLNDHFAGRPNIWVERFKLELRGSSKA